MTLPYLLNLIIIDFDHYLSKVKKVPIKNTAGKKYPLWLNIIDDQNRLWCGSEYGVYIFDPLQQQFENFI